MSGQASTLQLLSFVDPAAGAWGTVFREGEHATILWGAGPAALSSLSARCEDRREDGAQWVLREDWGELTFQSDGSTSRSTADAVNGLGQLSGTIRSAEREPVSLSAMARCCRWSAGAAALESIRDVCGFFAEGDAVALTSGRRTGGRGHESDLVAAAVLRKDAPVVEEGRLSTTYGSDAQPVRAGLELWFVAGEEEPEPLPLRMAGEAVSAPSRASAGRLTLSARGMNWHSQGREGAGTYLLAHFGA